MKKFFLFLSVFALLAVGKASAATGDVITGYVTHIDKSGTSHSVEMLFQISDQTNKFVRIYGYKNEEGYHSSLSLYAGYYEGEIIVPEKIGDYTVRSVGGNAFYDVKGKVTLPESVTEIEDYAFYQYLYNGYELALPSKVRYIGRMGFAYSRIKGISLPNTINNIGDYAFYDTKLEELVLPNSLYNVGKEIVGRCKSLVRLDVESGGANYYSPAGSNVVMDTKQYTIVAGCKSSKIPEETRRIAAHVFYEINLTNPIITIPESVGLIGEEAFAFSNVNKLIVKGETVDIQEYAFYDCNSLEHIYFYGDNVSVGQKAFESCGGLIDMYCYGHKPNIKPYARQFYDIGPNWQFGNSQVSLYAKYPDEYNEKFDTGTANLVWQNWFKDVLPLPEADILREIHVTDFDWPKIGNDADYAATSLTAHVTVNEIRYRRKSSTDEAYTWIKPTDLTEFTEDDKDYYYSVVFELAVDDGFTLSGDVKLFVDDKMSTQPVNVIDLDGKTYKRFFIDNIKPTVPSNGIPIKSVSITVPEPVAGQPLSNTVTSPTGEQYNLLKWTIDNVSWGYAAGASLDSYDPTKAYTLAALITAKQDYCFGTDCTFTLNGKKASVIRSRTADGRERVMLAVAYGNEEPVPEPIDISSVNITVADPVEGEEFPTEVVNPTPEAFEGLDYSLITVRWYNADKPFDVGDPGSLATGTYDPTKDYRIFVSIRGKYNCRILEGLNATINDRQAATLVFSDYIEEYEGLEYTAVLVAEYPATVAPAKELSGRFTVAEGKQVIFSQGNLQYKASNNVWRFAENQYDVQGQKNANVAEDYTDFIDIFGWGTSGFNGKNPWMTSDNSTDYGNGTNDIAGTDYDWGVYNSESIVNNGSKQWRTLTADEWYYLFYTRPNRGAGRATACDMHGYIILPDDWTLPDGLEFTKNAQTWDVNVYDADDWAKMEQAGAVFLPAAGYRYGATEYKGLGEWGYYWTSSAKNDNDAVGFYFAEYSFDADWSMGRENGYSVRLVSDFVQKRGDVNGDGKVNTADVVAVYTYIEKGDASGFTREACDVNGDNSVNTADVVAIYTLIIGEGASGSPAFNHQIFRLLSQ